MQQSYGVYMLPTSYLWATLLLLWKQNKQIITETLLETCNRMWSLMVVNMPHYN